MNKISEHECLYEDKIDRIYKRIDGNGMGNGMYTNLELLNEKVTAIIKEQDNNKLWFRGIVIGLGVLIITMLINYGATQNKIDSFDDVYVTKDYMMKVYNNQSEINNTLSNAVLGNKKDIENLQKAIEVNEKLFEYLRATRGATATTQKINK